MTSHTEDHDDTPKYLAISITVMVALAYTALLFVPIPEHNMQLVIQATTALMTGWSLAIGFYYNTNRNSSKAQDTMNLQARTAAATAPPAAPDIKVESGDKVTVQGA